MKFLNLTPHPLKIYDELGKEVLSLMPAENMRTPRVMQTNARIGEVHGVPIFQPEFGAVSNLPPAVDGVVYIVSRMVRQAVEGREDIVCPGPAIRDELGNIKGARGLSY